MSHPHETSDHRVLPPFSGEIREDEKLKLSHVDSKETVDDIFNGKTVIPLSQLSEMPLFTTPHVLAQFASKVYTDYKTGDTDPQYETMLALSDGWKLLTTASNIRRKNWYFGQPFGTLSIN